MVKEILPKVYIYLVIELLLTILLNNFMTTFIFSQGQRHGKTLAETMRDIGENLSNEVDYYVVLLLPWVLK